ncbi:MAG: AraC family transcriptional regulator [Bacteroides sp.]
MKALLPLLITCLLCFGCTHSDRDKADYLERELAAVPLLSAAFDSLLQQTRTLPASLRVSLLLNSALRTQTDRKASTKQESLLLEALNSSTKKEKKRILLALIEVYTRPDYGLLSAPSQKTIQRCEELENNYSLSKEERWTVMEAKAIMLDKPGQQDLYMPIWYQLLDDHKKDGTPEMIIKDLSIIANQLALMGDPEKAFTTYQEAYKLAITHQLVEQSNECLVGIINVAFQSGKYTDILRYCSSRNVDFFARIMPSIYSILASSYLQLGKPDSARIFFKKEINSFNLKPYCNIATTFIQQEQEDSAAFYLSKAMQRNRINAARAIKKNIKPSLPSVFIEVYPAFGTLLQKKGKMQQASTAFALIENLTKTNEIVPVAKKNQIDALTRYANFCQATGQYKKGLALFLRSDSLRTVYDKGREKRSGADLVERFKTQELLYTINIQKLQLAYSQRYLIFIGVILLLLLCASGALIYLYKTRQQRVSVLLNKKAELTKSFSSIPPPAQATSVPAQSQMEALFQSAQKEVTNQALFLNKDLSLEQLAKTLNTNRSYLSSCVNSCSGGNFNQWINNYRIAYVLERIHRTQNISKLAEEAGFLSTDAFGRNFKRYTQQTPSQYLKSHAKE